MIKREGGRKKRIGGTFRGLEQSTVGQWYPDVLCLTTVDGVGRDAVAEQFTLGTPTRLAPDAIITLLARRVKGDDDVVTHRKVGDLVALFHDGADELVPTDEVRRAFEVAAVEVEVGALSTWSESVVPRVEVQVYGVATEVTRVVVGRRLCVSDRLTHRAVDVTLRTASVGF